MTTTRLVIPAADADLSIIDRVGEIFCMLATSRNPDLVMTYEHAFAKAPIHRSRHITYEALPEQLPALPAHTSAAIGAPLSCDLFCGVDVLLTEGSAPRCSALFRSLALCSDQRGGYSFTPTTSQIVFAELAKMQENGVVLPSYSLPGYRHMNAHQLGFLSDLEHVPYSLLTPAGAQYYRQVKTVLDGTTKSLEAGATPSRVSLLALG